MADLELRMNQLLQDYRPTLGRRLEDYFGTAYLEAQHRLAPEAALNQTARGNNDYGLDGYHVDDSTGNVYLYQFKYSNDWRQFQVSMRRLIKNGIAKLFAATPLDVMENPLLQGLRAEIEELKPKLRCVYIRFVFTGNPKRAEDSDTLKDLQEQVLDRQYLLHECFGHEAEMRVQFLSTTVKSPPPVPPRVAKFTIDIGGDVLVAGPEGQIMQDGSKSTSVNQKISETLKRIVVDRTLSPSSFCFMHNGVTIYAQRLSGSGGRYDITEPRILNGAQTVATIAQL